MVLGIDVGGSTTKIVGFSSKENCVGMMQVEAKDPLTSAFGAFGKFMASYKLGMGDIKKIVMTGVGASYLQSMYDIPTSRIIEFKAIGLGGLKLAGLKSAIIVSIGTGTALVRAASDEITHIGGSGVGGGTLQKLASRFAGTSNFDSIMSLATQGDLGAVDLRLGDITREKIGNLPPETTVSNFGNLKDGATSADIVRGLINMIFESVGMMAVFATLNDDISDVVLIGSLTIVDQARDVLESLSRMHPICFHVPQDAIYATAVGAALSEF